jgi:hypothetical protein
MRCGWPQFDPFVIRRLDLTYYPTMGHSGRSAKQETYLSSENFAPLHSTCTALKPFSLPRYTWRPFAILKALGLSVAACDKNLASWARPAADHSRSVLLKRVKCLNTIPPRPSIITSASSIRPSFKRCAPLGPWQRSSSRTYQMHYVASQRLACIEISCSRYIL